MDERVPPGAEPFACQMSIKVPRKQKRLKKEEARVPNGWRSTQVRQNHLGNHWLHQEQQRGIQKNCQGKNEIQWASV